MTVSAFQLLHRSYISSALSQIIAFAGASFGGLVALVHLISFEDQLKIANTDVVVIVGIFTAIVILISLVPKFQDETITKEK